MSEERTQYTTPDEVAARLEVNERHIAQMERTLEGYEMVIGQHRGTMAEQKRRIAELEAQIAAMPLDALRRLVENCEWTLSEDYTAEQYVSDYGAAMSHFRKIDGAA